VAYGANSSVALTFYTTAIKPVLTYGHVALAGCPKSTVELLRRTESRALRLAIGAPKTAETLAVSLEAGVIPIPIVLRALTAGFLSKRGVGHPVHEELCYRGSTWQRACFETMSEFNITPRPGSTRTRLPPPWETNIYAHREIERKAHNLVRRRITHFAKLIFHRERAESTSSRLQRLEQLQAQVPRNHKILVSRLTCRQLTQLRLGIISQIAATNVYGSGMAKCRLCNQDFQLDHDLLDCPDLQSQRDLLLQDLQIQPTETRGLTSIRRRTAYVIRILMASKTAAHRPLDKYFSSRHHLLKARRDTSTQGVDLDTQEDV